jgi:hypothetical protein
MPVEPGPIRTSRRCEQPETDPREETSMASGSRTTFGRRLGVLIAGAVVVTAHTAATAATTLGCD